MGKKNPIKTWVVWFVLSVKELVQSSCLTRNTGREPPGSDPSTMPKETAISRVSWRTSFTIPVVVLPLLSFTLGTLTNTRSERNSLSPPKACTADSLFMLVRKPNCLLETSCPSVVCLKVPLFQTWKKRPETVAGSPGLLVTMLPLSPTMSTPRGPGLRCRQEPKRLFLLPIALWSELSPEVDVLTSQC